jgi:hypothetical protein
MTDKRVKYTQEQRDRAFDLYWEDRGFKEITGCRLDKPNKGKYMTGKYTLSQIAKMTGINPVTVGAIARGER